MSDLERFGRYVGEVRRMERSRLGALFDEAAKLTVDQFYRDLGVAPGDHFAAIAAYEGKRLRALIRGDWRHVPGFTCGAGKV